MKNKRLTWMLCLLMSAGTITTSCDVDRDDVTIRQEIDVTFFGYPSYVDEEQGYWYQDHFIELTPKDQTPYQMLIVTRDDQGDKLLDGMRKATNTVISAMMSLSNRQYFVESGLYYFESPRFYVSDAYRKKNDTSGKYDIWILPKLAVKMKESAQIDSILEQYKDKLTLNENETAKRWYILDCTATNSYEVLQLAAEIAKLDGVEWAEPSMYSSSISTQ